MTFQILDPSSLQRLESYGKVENKSTWVKGTCPVCGGTLKITKNPLKYGAYACYTNDCHKTNPKKLRQALGGEGAFRSSKAFKYTPPKPISLTRLINSRPLTNLKGADFKSEIRPCKLQQSTTDDSRTTYFDYNEFRLVRVDYKSEEGVDKYTYPMYSVNGKWMPGLPPKFSAPPIYDTRFIENRESIVIVEGEKVAHTAQYLGLAAVTLASFSWQESNMKNIIEHLKSLGIVNILYLSDNDKAGEHKGQLVTRYAWDAGVSASSFNLATLYPEYSSVRGWDLYDAWKCKKVDENSIFSVLDGILA